MNKSSYFFESVAFDIYLVVAEPVASHIAKRKRVARLSLTNAITREHKGDVVNMDMDDQGEVTPVWPGRH